MGQTPNLEDVMDDAVERGLFTLYTHVPAKVVKFYKDIQAVDVVPAVIRDHFNADGDVERRDPPMLPRVPVLYPGGGGLRITWALRPGDYVLLAFCNSDISAWKENGGFTHTYPARGSFTDCFALPGLHDFNHAPAATPDPRFMIIQMEPGKALKVGGANAVNKVALKRDIDRIKDCLLDSAVISGIGAIALDGGASYRTAVNAYFTAHPLTGSKSLWSDEDS